MRRSITVILLESPFSMEGFSALRLPEGPVSCQNTLQSSYPVRPFGFVWTILCLNQWLAEAIRALIVAVRSHVSESYMKSIEAFLWFVSLIYLTLHVLGPTISRIRTKPKPEFRKDYHHKRTWILPMLKLKVKIISTNQHESFQLSPQTCFVLTHMHF